MELTQKRMSHDLAHWVRTAAGRRILLVGDLILDRYIYGDAERISPEAPVPVIRVVERREAVGGSANVAACLRALGCDVRCCGMIGADRHGATLRRLLHEIHVPDAGLLEVSDRPTTTKTRIVGLAQHRHRQQLMRVDEEDASPLSRPTLDRLIDLCKASLTGVDVVCLEDYDKGLINEEVAQAVIKAATKAGIPVLVDPARLKDYARYAGATAVTPNRDELAIASAMPTRTIDEVTKAAREVIRRHGIQSAVATIDREGCVVIDGGNPPRHLPTIPRTVYDNTGAGDAVLAMLAAALAAGADLESAARLANISGGLEVEKFGCVPITSDEILAELRLADRIHNGKLTRLDELLGELRLRRDRGETVAFTNGCFDILHAGHVDLLRRCRNEASLLVVGLNSDASVRAQNKGADRPINNFENRAAVLSALEFVDYVIAFEESTPESLIRRIRPDVLLKGADWAGKGVVGSEFVESYGGRVVLLPLVQGLSTTQTIERIRS